MNTKSVNMVINGKSICANVSVGTLLVDFLRDELKLTGTHKGCDCVSCGACTVLIDDMPVKSCSVLTLQCHRKNVRTVEGLDKEGLSELQEAFRQHFALQCGYCTPGLLMVGTHLIEENNRLTTDEIAEIIKGNYCRCTGYTPVIEAIYETLENRRNKKE